jgi:transcriptional regulator with XRE-family HTH domain
MPNYSNLKEVRKRRPVNEAKVRRMKDSILSENTSLRLVEFRRALNLTQEDLAIILGIDQSNISRIERGSFASTEIGTLQAYVEALGGKLEIRAKMGKRSHKLIDSEYEKSMAKK